MNITKLSASISISLFTMANEKSTKLLIALSWLYETKNAIEELVNVNIFLFSKYNKVKNGEIRIW
jgi:hypothetical protein